MALHAALFVFVPLLYLSVVGQQLERETLPKYADHVPPRTTPLRSDEVRLLDTVLLATVDGRFHALNRTTGRLIWTMELPSADSQLAIGNLKDMVRSEHGGLYKEANHVLEPDKDAFSGTYIIEPQTGHVFVHPAYATRDEPLQRLPFTMAQLVEMSPFHYDDHGIFVGNMTTSLITLDLASGELLESLHAEQCRWGDSLQSGAKRALLQIRRTDYQISVFSKGKSPQKLTLSVYGPSNIDKDLQALWQRTPDRRYHQSTPDGTLLMFKTDKREPLQSFLKLEQPIVAVFDIVSLSGGSTPLALLQPTPDLSELYPRRHEEFRDLDKKQDLVYVGRISDSLYALSQSTYKHVIFTPCPSVSPAQLEKDWGIQQVLDAVDVDIALQEVCTSLDCLVGVHRSAPETPGV